MTRGSILAIYCFGALSVVSFVISVLTGAVVLNKLDSRRRLDEAQIAAINRNSDLLEKRLNHEPGTP